MDEESPPNEKLQLKQNKEQQEIEPGERVALHRSIYRYFQWWSIKETKNSEESSPPATEGSANDKEKEIETSPILVALEQEFPFLRGAPLPSAAGQTELERRFVAYPLHLEQISELQEQLSNNRYENMKDAVKIHQAVSPAITSKKKRKPDIEMTQKVKRTKDKYSQPSSTGTATNGLAEQKKNLSNSIAKSCDAIGLPASDVPWETRIEQLTHFQKGYGHCRVPCRYKPNPSLGRFVQTLRNSYKKRLRLQEQKQAAQQYASNGNHTSDSNNAVIVPAACTTETEDSNVVEGYFGLLTNDRIKQLESIGFEWSVKEPRSLTWEQRFAQLSSFRAQFGHANVPRDFRPIPGLGEWVHTQRKDYRIQRPIFVNSDRPTKLTSIGFEWNTDSQPRQGWDERFEQLVEFRRQNGHCDVPPPVNRPVSKSSTSDSSANDCGEGSSIQKQNQSDTSFRRWVQFQRTEYKKFKDGKDSALDTKKFKKLESIVSVNWGKERVASINL